MLLLRSLVVSIFPELIRDALLRFSNSDCAVIGGITSVNQSLPRSRRALLSMLQSLILLQTVLQLLTQRVVDDSNSIDLRKLRF